MTAQIYEYNGPTKSRIDVTHNADGSVTVTGCDWGAGPESFYGTDELNYDLRIPANAVPGAVTALLRALLATSGTPMTTLRAALDSDQVEHTFRILP